VRVEQGGRITAATRTRCFSNGWAGRSETLASLFVFLNNEPWC
jgi:hypothetical protein